MKKQLLIITLFTALFLSPYLSNSQDIKSASVKISGEVKTALDLKLSDLTQYPQTDIVRKDKDGKDHTYSGVILEEILKKAGVTTGADLRKKNLTKYVLIDARDGYQVVFALAELDKDFTDRQIILADKVDRRPLSNEDGPFRIIVQDEKKPARCIKQVTSIKVLFARE